MIVSDWQDDYRPIDRNTEEENFAAVAADGIGA